MSRFVPFLSIALVAWTPLVMSGQSYQESSGPLSSPEATADASPGPVVTPPAGTPDHDRLAPRAAAVRAESAPEIDGRLDERLWSEAPAVTAFVQREPVEGAPPSQPTEVRFAFDDHTLYVGARMRDEAAPEGIVSRLVRRDASTESDRLTLTFDTFLDHLGRTVFTVNPAGSRRDAYGPGGSNLDDSWDPVWTYATRVDDDGWTAEMAIPFSQLRFERGVDPVFGLQIEREINRLNEIQVWSFWRREDQGGPSRYGHLTGIEAPKASLDRLEILPYAVLQAETAGDVDEADPFDVSRDSEMRMGADLAYLLTSDLTLSATVNPDFGQAEVDPAVVNLSAFETFFPEKREFFIEGSGLFDFGGLWCFTCSNMSSLSMLFTRRIGRAPQAVSLAEDAGEFVDAPDATTILTAAKVTGRTRGGTSIGVLGALTAREDAAVAGVDGGPFEQEVMPRTSYFVGRVKQDLADGDVQIGGIATSVVRSFDDPALEELLPSHSEGLGVDAEAWWSDRTYHLLSSAAITNVSGSEAAILDLQTSSARYFQRPDRDRGSNGLFTDRFDPTLTAIRGYGFYARVAKEAGEWRWEGSVNAKSPGFENNDIAFTTRTDFLMLHGNLQRRWTTPTSWYRWLQVTGGGQRQTNFDGDVTFEQVHTNVFYRAPNYWETSLFAMVRPRTLSDRLTRGGPVVADNASGFVSWWMSSDPRKPVVVEANPTTAWNEEGARDWGLSLDLTLRPASNVSLSVGPRFDHSESTDQFVTSVDDPTAEAFFGTRYVFADLEQKTFSMNTRLDWTFTPTMSLELFAQPFVSSNDFSRLKEFAAPRRLEKVVYGEDVGTISSDGEGAFVIDPDGDGPAASFAVDDPDFNFRSLRGNLVFRWEYLPGSTLFLVWTQDRNASVSDGDFDFGRDLGGLFDAEADNVFLVKATYWLGI